MKNVLVFCMHVVLCIFMSTTTEKNSQPRDKALRQIKLLARDLKARGICTERVYTLCARMHGWLFTEAELLSIITHA